VKGRERGGKGRERERRGGEDPLDLLPPEKFPSYASGYSRIHWYACTMVNNIHAMHRRINCDTNM